MDWIDASNWENEDDKMAWEKFVPGPRAFTCTASDGKVARLNRPYTDAVCEWHLTYGPYFFYPLGLDLSRAKIEASKLCELVPPPNTSENSGQAR